MSKFQCWAHAVQFYTVVYTPAEIEQFREQRGHCVVLASVTVDLPFVIPNVLHYIFLSSFGI